MSIQAKKGPTLQEPSFSNMTFPVSSLALPLQGCLSFFSVKERAQGKQSMTVVSDREDGQQTAGPAQWPDTFLMLSRRCLALLVEITGLFFFLMVTYRGENPMGPYCINRMPTTKCAKLC